MTDVEIAWLVYGIFVAVGLIMTFAAIKLARLEEEEENDAHTG